MPDPEDDLSAGMRLDSQVDVARRRVATTVITSRSTCRQFGGCLRPRLTDLARPAVPRAFGENPRETRAFEADTIGATLQHVVNCVRHASVAAAARYDSEAPFTA